MGPQGSSSRLPSPRRWESELRLASADSGSELMKLCLRRSRVQCAAEFCSPQDPSFLGVPALRPKLSVAGAYLR
jgi:hypothetical protein